MTCFEDLAEELVLILDCFDLKPAPLFTWSAGSMIATAFATFYCSRVKNSFFIAPAKIKACRAVS